MAGFANIGDPGFSISPPRLSPIGASGYLGISIPSNRQPAGFSSLPNEAASQTDNSPMHLANVWLKQNGLNPSWSTQQQGNGYGGAPRGSAEDSYGMSASDWLQATRFLSNPMDPNNISGYNDLVGRIRGAQNGTITPGHGSIPGLTNDQFDYFTQNMPLILGSAFNILPPSILQNWPIPTNDIPGLRF